MTIRELYTPTGRKVVVIFTATKWLLGSWLVSMYGLSNFCVEGLFSDGNFPNHSVTYRK